MGIPGHINILPWSSRFDVITINEVSFNRPEVVAGFGVTFCFCWLRPIRVSLKFSSLQENTSSELILGLHDHSFALPSASGNMKNSPFLDVNISFALSIRAWISEASNLPRSSISATIIYLTRFSPQPMHTRGIFLVRISYQIGGAFTGLSLKSSEIHPLLQKELLGF